MTPLLIEAHRGASANAPENTLAAFRRALDLGVASIELDVHTSRGGLLMVIHDDTVDRTSDGSGPVAELRRLDAGTWFALAFAGGGFRGSLRCCNWSRRPGRMPRRCE